MTAIVQSPIRNQVYAHLLRQILAGTRTAGQRLQDTIVADELGVSRTPVREAMLRLSQEGLLEVRPHRGFRVRALDVSELRDVYPILWTLEGLAVSMVGEFDASILDELARISRDFANPANEPLRLLEADTLWHETLVADCGNHRLLDQIRQHRTIVRRYEVVYMHSLDLTARSKDDHERILELLRKRRARLAIDALERHWRRSFDEISRLSIVENSS